jgi:hypothetical protein
MLAWLLGHSYQPFQAQAVIRSAWVETRLKPCTVGRSGNFLFQWTGARLTALRRFAGTSGCPPLDVQLAFADHELRTAPAYAAFWRASPAIVYRVFRHNFEGCRRC